MKSVQSCFEVFNLASGVGFSVFEIIDEFELATGCKIPYVIVEGRNSDISIFLADITKSKKILVWFPKYNLRQIFIDAWNWQKYNLNGYI